MNGYPPNKTLWIVIVDGNLDGSVDFHWELPAVFESREEADQFAGNISRDDDGPLGCFIYEARPAQYVAPAF